MSKNQIITIFISIIAVIISLWSAYNSYQTNSIMGFGNTIQEQMKDFQKESIALQNNISELEKRKLWFDVVTQLSRDLDSVPNSEEMRMKFLKKELVEDQMQMTQYINIFEDIYFSCHRGIAPRDDIKYTFNHHLQAICGNPQVIDFIGDTHGGLKKLCAIFHPNSKIAPLANMKTNNCN